MRHQLRVYAQRLDWSKNVEFAIALDHHEGYSCAKPIVLEKREEGDMISSAFTLEPQSVQFLMDELWRCGYRPSEGEGSAGQLSSVKYHLEDMRKLVFNRMGELK